MSDALRLLRSVLYVPGSRPDAMEKARSLPVDAVLLDLEDSVAPDAKDAARERVCHAFGTGGWGHRRVLVRVNGLGSPWFEEDVAALATCRPDGIVLPKVGGSQDIATLLSRLPDGTPVWAMIEGARGVLAAAAIAASPGTGGLILGTNDLARDLGCRVGPARAPIGVALQTCVLAARAAGIPCLDGVFGDLGDEAGLRAECRDGRDLGMDGKTLIHPHQIAVANAAFSPTGAEIEEADRIVVAFDAALARGQGVAVLDGRMIENLHVDIARETLARSAAIVERRDRK